jgi:hypothetical protein
MALLEMPIASVRLAIHFGPHDPDVPETIFPLLLLTVTADGLGWVLFDPPALTKRGNPVQFWARKFDDEVSITDRATAKEKSDRKEGCENKFLAVKKRIGNRRCSYQFLLWTPRWFLVVPGH